MSWIGRILFGESRSSGGSLENPSVPLSAATLADFGETDHSMDAGVSVTVKSALGYAPLHQAVSMISGDVAKLPLNVYLRTEQGKKRQPKHPVDRRISLKSMANAEVNAFKFWRRFMVSALLHGNAFAWIDRNGRGDVLGVYNLLPDRTVPARYKGELWYLTEVGGAMEAFRAANVMHVEGLCINGLAAESTVKLFREDFGIALARRKFTARFFKQGMTAGGILQVPPTAKPEAVRKIQGKINEKFSGTESAFKTIVLRDGFKWFSTQVDPERAQLAEMDEQQARNVARMFNLNPSRLGVAGSTSYNSDEMAMRDYHNCALSHWLIGNVSEAHNKLLSEEERDRDFYIDYNINAMLWADAKTRSEIANTGIINGRYSPNETRAWENYDDYEGGDTYYQPLNVVPVGTPLGERSQSLEALLRSTFTRAINRLSIRTERVKPFSMDVVEAERSTILEMLCPAIAVALEWQGRNANESKSIGTTWFETLLRSKPGDASALRVTAESTAAETIRKLLASPPPEIEELE